MKLPKILTLATLTVALFGFSGCTSTEVDGGDFKMKRVSVFQKIGIAEASHSADGTFILKGYQNDGGNQALANALVTMTQMVQMMQAAQGMPAMQPATVTPPAALRSAPALRNAPRNTPPPSVQPAFPAPSSAP